MILSVAGTRQGAGLELVVHQFIAQVAAHYPDTIVVTGGRGVVDQTAEKTARASGLDVISYRPREHFHGKEQAATYEIFTYAYGDRAEALVTAKGRRLAAPTFFSFGMACYFRNGWVIDDGDRLAAFWDGHSRGTSHAIECASIKGIPISLKLPSLPMREILSLQQAGMSHTHNGGSA